jgi:hypothetical protein
MSARLSSWAPKGDVWRVSRATVPSRASKTIATNSRSAATSILCTTAGVSSMPRWLARSTASADFAMARNPKNTFPRVTTEGSTGTVFR